VNALATAQAGDTLTLAPGTYSPSPNGLTITQNNLTITGPTSGPGATISGGAVSAPNPDSGANDPIDVVGSSFSLENVTITGAQSPGQGGAAAIDDLGSVDLENDAFLGNSNIVVLVNPGATATIRNTTIANNSFSGSATAVDTFGDVQIFNTTIDHNDAGIFMDGGTAELTNTIVSHNSTGDCPGGPVTSSVKSFDTNATCGLDLPSTDPKLGTPNLNGGTTDNEAPQPGSPAINAGTNSPCPAEDQRYAARNDGHCDIGAVEAQVPVITVPSDITAEATSSSGAAVNYTVTATDGVGGPALPTPTCTPASGSTFPIATTAVNCTSTDPAGFSSSASFNVTVHDTTAPVITPPADVTAEATSPAGAVVNYPNATATDAVDGTDPVTCTPASGSTFPLGTTTVNCTSHDAAGNSSSASFHVTVHDTTAPSITVPSDITAEATSSAGAIVMYSASASDAVGVTSFACNPATGSTFPLGTTTVNCTANDAAGNQSSASFHVTVRDTTPPVITVPADISTPATSPAGAVVTYTATASDTVDPAPTLSCTPASGSTFPIGTTTVTCNASDASSNHSSKTFHVTVTDTSAPTLHNVPSDITAEATSSAGAVVTYTNPTATDPVDPNPTVSCSPASGSTFPLGTTTVTCTATDSAGNHSSASFHVTVHDTTPPAIHNVPSDITAEATSPVGATVNYTNPTATDAVDGTDPVTCTPASGSTFPLGPTTVNCTSQDAAGNSSSASFHVTVHDTTAPSITVPSDITAEATSSAGAIVMYSASASDAVGVTSFACNPSSGSTFPLGTTTVNCTASDAAGNQSSASFHVTVHDTTPPTLHGVPADITTEATSSAGATVSYTNPTATDAVDGTDPVTCMPASGSTFPLGTTTVNCTSQDAAHNSTSASFHVTVQDTTPPVLSLPANITDTATDPFGMAETFSATSTDAVDGSVPVTCSAASGFKFPVGTTTVSCSATDAHGNTANGSFTVHITRTVAATVSVANAAQLQYLVKTCVSGDVLNLAAGNYSPDAPVDMSCNEAINGPSSGSAQATLSGGAVSPPCPTCPDDVIIVEPGVSATINHLIVTLAPTDGTGIDVFGTVDVENSNVAGTDTTGVIGEPGSSIVIRNSTIAVNHAAGVDVFNDAQLFNDTLSGNGWGVFREGGATVEATNTILAGNTHDCNVPLTSSDHNLDQDGSCGTGLTANPKLGPLTANGGPTLTQALLANSPAIDAGDSNVCPTTDERGVTRDAMCDIGAYEYVDTTPPVITVPSDITAEASSSAGATVNYTASASDDTNVASFSCTPPSGSTFPLGTTTVTCNATDTHGNSSSKSFHVTVKDTTPPTISAQADITAEATSPAGATVTYSTPTATDAVDGTDPVTCSPASGSTFPIGTTMVNCQATDNAGNIGHSSFHVIVQDTTAPAITVPGDITMEATAPMTPVTYSATASDAVGVTSFSCSPASGSGFPVGTTTVTCTASDAAGNTSHASFHVTITDTTAPTITVPSDITMEATGPMTPVSYSASASDAVGVTSFSCTPASGSMFPLGTTTVNCTASDKAGNTSTASFHVTVQDTTPPTMTGVPSNQTVSTSNPSGAVVTYTNPTATDLVDGPVPVNCSPASGSTFPIGTTTVNCTASDAHGNTTTKSFTVTVNLASDTTPPVISGLPGSSSVEATGPTGASFAFHVTVKDPDDAGTFQCSGGPVANFDFPVNANGNVYSYTVTAPVGVNTITCNATDSHGNHATPQSFTLTVTDTTPPVIGPAPNVTVNATSPTGAIVNYTLPTATDLVDGTVPVTCTPAPGSQFPNGTTLVTCKATDHHGNTATKTFNVTVLSANDQLSALKASVTSASELAAAKSVRKLLQSDLKGAGGNNKTKSCAALASFIADVQANTPPITAAHSSAWVASAQAIELARGC
jgi:hypothetical protein